VELKSSALLGLGLACSLCYASGGELSGGQSPKDSGAAPATGPDSPKFKIKYPQDGTYRLEITSTNLERDSSGKSVIKDSTVSFDLTFEKKTEQEGRDVTELMVVGTKGIKATFFINGAIASKEDQAHLAKCYAHLAIKLPIDGAGTCTRPADWAKTYPGKDRFVLDCLLPLVPAEQEAGKDTFVPADVTPPTGMLTELSGLCAFSKGYLEKMFTLRQLGFDSAPDPRLPVAKYCLLGANSDEMWTQVVYYEPGECRVLSSTVWRRLRMPIADKAEADSMQTWYLSFVPTAAAATTGKKETSTQQ
jgi:hypothetical protein